jgi:hypothetical protein
MKIRIWVYSKKSDKILVGTDRYEQEKLSDLTIEPFGEYQNNNFVLAPQITLRVGAGLQQPQLFYTDNKNALFPLPANSTLSVKRNGSLVQQSGGIMDCHDLTIKDRLEIIINSPESFEVIHVIVVAIAADDASFKLN